MSCGFRISTVTGTSRGARGTDSRRSPASRGSRSALNWLIRFEASGSPNRGSRSESWSPGKELHLPWRRSRRRVAADWTTRAMMWSLPPELLRLGLRTTAPRQAAARRRDGLPSRSLGEGWSQPPVLPWARRAYETCLSAGSTAGSGAGERSRTVVSALARPHSAVEPHPQVLSPAGVSPATFPF